MSNNPTPFVSTEKLAKLTRYLTENFLRAGKSLPQEDYFKSAVMTWVPIIDFIPVAMWDKCYADAVANLPEGEFVTAHRIKAAWPRVKAANTTNMFDAGQHYEIRTCPRCGRQFSGLTHSTLDIIVERRCAASDQHCRPCPGYLLQLHGVRGARLTVEQMYEVLAFLPEVPTTASMEWVRKNIRVGGEVQGWQKQLLETYGK